MLLLTTMLILGCCSGASTEPHMQTFQHEDPYSGRLLECQLCPPGTYLRKACSDDSSKSDCATCPTGSFTELWNFIPKCLRCGMCVGNRVVKKECTPSQDCVCECKQGYYFNKWLQDCTRHTECSSGYGVISKGTAEKDSKCEQCSSGFFSVEISSDAPCTPHSSCTAADKHVMLKGRTWHDVICASCAEIISRDGAEFLRQILPGFVSHDKMSVSKMRRFVKNNPPAGSSRPTHASISRLSQSDLIGRIKSWVHMATVEQIRKLPETFMKSRIIVGADKLQWRLERIDALVKLCKSKE
ncbi:tumor necrosis factor receptor superfamily member 11B-like [Osmerus eperlanus]|uniref:tumor necrosis factor receptor superfamily member 11B-like n=1 Tax=Osmerus eperlanus TaxID=29151 RepID=UPI002E115737